MRPRGTCRECGIEFALTVDKVVRWHGARGSAGCPGAGKRPRGRHVTFACLTDSHGTCGGHDDTAAKPCECPDLFHAVTQTNALASWDASTSDPAADLEAAVAIVNDAATASVLVDHPDGALNCSYERNLEGILECEHGCGRTIPDNPHPRDPLPATVSRAELRSEWLTDAEAEVQLTDAERVRIIAAHREQYPHQALEVCRSILEERLRA
jgi:hypothetical protein